MSFLHTYARYPLEIVTGEGCRLRATDGRWYLDGIAGIAVMALGHRHPAVRAAVHAQVDALLHVSNLYSVGVQTALADLLSQTFGGGSVFFSNSGSEANETAMKLVRKHHSRRGDPRHEVVVLEHAFHGRTLMALSMTPKPRYQEGMGPMAEGIVVATARDAAAAVGPRTAAVVVEPVQGEGGCRPVEVLPELRAACDAHGALLVYDEIQCGLGRTGRLHHDPEPDVRTLAKALGGGLPLGAVVAAPHLADTFQPGDHGSTFGGNPVACAASLATLRTILDEGLIERCKVAGARLRTGLGATGVEVRGTGLMLAAVVGEAAPAVVEGMRERGALVCPAGPDAVRFLPPYVISDGEIDALVNAFDGALRQAVSD